MPKRNNTMHRVEKGRRVDVVCFLRRLLASPDDSDRKAPEARTADPSGSAVEKYMLALINTEREIHLGPGYSLRFDSKLAAAAQHHSLDMSLRNYFSHSSPEAEDVTKRLQKSGTRYTAAGENIALENIAGRTIVLALRRQHEGLMGSPAHRENILNPYFNAAGLGIIERKGRLYTTQVFANLDGTEVMSQSKTGMREQGNGNILAAAVLPPSALNPPQVLFERRLGPLLTVTAIQRPQIRETLWNLTGKNEKWLLAFPYCIFVLGFLFDDFDRLYVYYSNEPVDTDRAMLYQSNLSNVYPDDSVCLGHGEQLQKLRAGLARLANSQRKAANLIEEFWSSQFNGGLVTCRFLPVVQREPALSTLEAWARHSRINRDFILRVRWTPACTTCQAIERYLHRT